MVTIIKSGIKKKQFFEVASDGGLSDSWGHFWRHFSTRGQGIWELAGPVDGDYTTANSKRSKLAGYAASLEFILLLIPWLEMGSQDKLHLQTWIDISGAGRHRSNLLTKKKSKRKYPHGSQDKLHLQTWIDSSGAGRHFPNLLTKKKSKRKYPHNANLISHIHRLWLHLSKVNQKISWVKGHQDTQRSYSELPQNVQLNVLADKLATAFAKGQSTTKCPPKSNQVSFPQV